VDAVPLALSRAAERARPAAVTVRWVRGDVTELEDLELGDDHTLLLDFGCFHGLTDPQRGGAAAGMSKLAAPGATLLLFAFEPGRRGPAPRGLDAAELRDRFPGWELTATRPATEVQLKGPLRNARPSWYRLIKQ
jgi:hypothetical protein